MELTKEQQEQKDALEQKAIELTAQAEDLQGQITVLSTLQHDVLVCRDACWAQAGEIENGKARIEPLTLEAVRTAIAASKVQVQPEPIEKKVAG